MPCTVKKTTQLIIEGGNDYVITVKGNQPQLLTQLKDKAEHQKPCPRFVDVEKTRGRITCRIVQIFTELKNIDLDWVGVIALFKLNASASAIGLQYLQTNHYISSLVSKATTFADGIRQHWGIENRLHWGGVSAGEVSPAEPPFKDVVFGEDAAPFSNYNAATNWSIIRNIAINLARLGGYDSLTKAERFLAHDIDKLFLLLE